MRELQQILPVRWQQASTAFTELCASRSPQEQALLRDAQAELVTLWVFSEFAQQTSVRHPDVLLDLLRHKDLERDYSPTDYEQRVREILGEGTYAGDLALALRIVRMREMLRLAWRDLLGKTGAMQTCLELSRLAQALLQAAVEQCDSQLEQEYGAPHDAQGGRQRLVVLGMGKLGAQELNFSSDIDLIFAFPENGQTDRKGLSNQEYFTRLGQRVIKLFNESTAHGFLFRVDMRLRPYGESGPLVVSFTAMEDYYQLQGRDWERYAMIKARPVAGDLTQGQVLLNLLKPFVYRRYLDFAAFQSLREMKQLVETQVKRKGMQDNIKLGGGGIREVEFIGQTFQLVRGGRQSQLQQRGILAVLTNLAQWGYLPEYVVNELKSAYVFLRKVENTLQAFADQQTHRLPKHEQDRLRLALTLGFETWESFSKELEQHRRKVSQHFEQVFAAPQTGQWDEQQQRWLQVWRNVRARKGMTQLAEHGYDAEEVLRLLQALQDAAFYRSLPAAGKSRFDQLIPLLLGAHISLENPTEGLQRSLAVVQSIARRTAYLALLVENPLALSQLVKLCGASPWIAEIIAKHPILLDELLDPRRLYAPLKRRDLEQELSDMLASAGEEDLESRMDIMRQFRGVNMLRVAAADISGVLPLMRVSDFLTDIAEVVLGQALRGAWAYMLARHGWPSYREDGQTRQARFIVVGYGKLGGIELGYGSDLDLVFLHDSRGEAQESDGPRGLDNATYFARLAQRLLHVLSTRTSAGVLYEVDVRLRPDGNAGMLVSSMQAFEHYQQQRAWTWEHQALVRARAVAGDPELAQAFTAVRVGALTKARDARTLRADVTEMRQRMKESSKQSGARFHLKVGFGGITDVEFIVQYLVLRWAHDYPQLVLWTDNIRQMASLRELGLLSSEDAAFLEQAYKTLRAGVHRLSLQGEAPELDADALPQLREGVEAIWQKVLESG